jgi:HSP20 family protein
MFTNRFRAFERGAEMTWTPRIDVLTKDGDLMVRADLPGMKKEDVKVMMEDGDLVLQGERKDASEVKEENFYRAECTYGAFYRRLPLAFKVDFAKVTAKFNDGVLEIRLPMPAKDAPKPTEIPVN